MTTARVYLFGISLLSRRRRRTAIVSSEKWGPSFGWDHLGMGTKLPLVNKWSAGNQIYIKGIRHTLKAAYFVAEQIWILVSEGPRDRKCKWFEFKFIILKGFWFFCSYSVGFICAWWMCVWCTMLQQGLVVVVYVGWQCCSSDIRALLLLRDLVYS